MSRFALPGSPPAEPAGEPAVPPAQEEPSSEFISEHSPEVRAMWARRPVVGTAPSAAVEPGGGDEPAASARIDEAGADALSEVPAAVDADADRTLPGSEVSPRVSIVGAPAGELPLAAVPLVPPAPLPIPPASPLSGPLAPRSNRAAGALPAAGPPASRWRVGAILATILLVIAGIGVPAYFLVRARANPARNVPAPPAVVEGTAMVVSRPAGADVFINGTNRGQTPLKLSLPAGTYELELRNGASKRSLSMTIDPSTAVREFVDLAPDGGFGTLEVTTDTPGARVTVDGTYRGVTPLTLADVEPGPRRVVVSSATGTVTRNVTVTAGATAAVVASIVPAGSTGGWVTIDAPIEMQVMEDGRVIGTTGADRVMLPAGRHDLHLVAPGLEFDTGVVADIPAGKTIVIPVAVPNGTLSINASPWADVLVDGRAVGSTPIGNLTLPIGPHEVIWRHPQFGERRQTVRVAARTPGRVGMDMSK
jgi:hypothetical protein